MDVIDFLEELGRTPQARCASAEELKQALVCAGVRADARTALLRNERRHLEELLGAKAITCCAIQPADDEDEKDDEGDSDDDEKPGTPESRLLALRSRARAS